jgi:membrane protein implicated in regulation of membrane protease activity
MEQLTWIFWIVLAVILIVAEIFTLGFFLFSFGIGALAAAAIGVFGFGLAWQFAVFAIVSTVLTVMSRTLFSKYASGAGREEIKMGADSLPGMVGTVTSPSQGALNAGAVRVYGSEWTAFPADGEGELIEGEKVEVVEVKGASIYVRAVRKEIPGWKQE